MATNLSIDPELIERALALSGERTKKAAVTKALQEFIARRQQKRVLELFGKLEMGRGLRLQGGAPTPVSLFVDTSVWSLALRRDQPAGRAEVGMLVRAIEGGETLLTTGLVLQELLQGFAGPKSRSQIVERFSALPLIVPDRDDHIDAAELQEPLPPKRRADRNDRRASGAGVHAPRRDDADRRPGFHACRRAHQAEGLVAAIACSCFLDSPGEQDAATRRGRRPPSRTS